MEPKIALVHMKHVLFQTRFNIILVTRKKNILFILLLIYQSANVFWNEVFF